MMSLNKPKPFKLFRIRGGVHPDDRKSLSADQGIRVVAMPPLLHIPLQQHIGATAESLVQRGQQVKKGQLLARSQGMISAPVHAPTSGRVAGVGSFPAHHASGLSVRTITLQPDGKDEWTEDLEAHENPFQLSSDEIASAVAKAGIVGMGGATFPSAVKLSLGKKYKIHTLVINGAECEPYLTCDDRLMQEYPHELLMGILLMAKALGVHQVYVAIENNKPLALEKINQTLDQVKHISSEYDIKIEVIGLPTQYPMGSEKHLVQTLTGKETPARALTADIGIVVHNGATARAVYHALFHGKPLISRIMTVSGDAISQPSNLDVLMGTPLCWLVEQCGGFREKPARIISGGPMMGQPLQDTRVPVVKGSNGLLALTQKEVRQTEPMPCIRCANCVQACPCGLVPLEMSAHIRAGNLDQSVNLGLLDCIGCGSCSYVCPSHIPLVQYFNYAKGELAERQRQQHKQGETKKLIEARNQRMEAIKKAKREAMLKRKKEMEARKKKAPEKAAAEA